MVEAARNFAGKLDMWRLILPHGLLELMAIFVAAGVGLRLFWAWVAPGQRTRLDSLAAEGRSLVTVAVGLVLVLAVSGVVEGFVTPSALPHWLRLGLGAAVLPRAGARAGPRVPAEACGDSSPPPRHPPRPLPLPNCPAAAKLSTATLARVSARPVPTEGPASSRVPRAVSPRVGASPS